MMQYDTIRYETKQNKKVLIFNPNKTKYDTI